MDSKRDNKRQSESERRKTATQTDGDVASNRETEAELEKREEETDKHQASWRSPVDPSRAYLYRCSLPTSVSHCFWKTCSVLIGKMDDPFEIPRDHQAN